MPVRHDVIKSRELKFVLKLTGGDAAVKAEALLLGVRGIESVSQSRAQVLQIRYDVRLLTLQMIEAALNDVGFQLETNLIKRIQRSLIAYCEDTQRASLGVEHDTEQSLLNHPETITHDPRPHNWRNYL